MSGLAQVVTSAQTSLETREKATLQLISSINPDHEKVPEVHTSAIAALSIVLSQDTCPSKLKEDLLLPKLCHFLQSDRIAPRESLARQVLDDIYKPLLQYLDSDLEENVSQVSLNCVQLHVAPGLSKIACDSQKFGWNLGALGLIGKLEAIHGISFNNQTSAGANASLSTSKSMDEMKQKVGKLFQMHSGQAFWKKGN